MIAGQLPAPQIFGDLQPVSGSEVTPQRLAAKAALETDNMVVLNGALDRHSRHSRRLGLNRRTELADGPLDRGDQRRELVRRQHVISDIAGNDLGDRTQIGGFGCRFGIHFGSPPKRTTGALE